MFHGGYSPPVTPLKNEVVLSPGQIVGATELLRGLPKCFNMAKKKPLFIMRNSEIEAVLLSIEEYRKLLGGE